jgi:hypothetical protein
MLFFASMAAVGLAQPSQDTSRTKIGNPELRRKLLAMADIDQKMRNELISKMSAHPIDSMDVARLDSIDDLNTKRFKEIIAQNGWPGISMVGNDGAEAVFLVVQHSRDTLFQRSCLALLQNAFMAGGASGQHLALLTDRVRLREGKAQLYGSQAKIVDGKLVLEPIEDEANVDKRRAELGLPPLSKYLELLKQVYHLKDK